MLSGGEIFVLETKNADIDSWLVIKIETLLLSIVWRAIVTTTESSDFTQRLHISIFLMSLGSNETNWSEDISKYNDIA